MKLSEYVQSLQVRAVYTFRQDEAHQAVGGSIASIRLAIYRLIKKGKIVRLAHGFFGIIPIEYFESGSPPPDWYIDDLMRFHQTPYYVGILSAAALHGASHQPPFEFQVITNQQMRPLSIGKWQIRFYKKMHLENSSTTKIKTYTGYFKVSTPETTAFDLVRYVKAAGYLQNVATALSELSELIDPTLLVKEAKTVEMSVVQRVGYLLENFSEENKAQLLHDWMKKYSPKLISLRPDQPTKGAKRDSHWNVLINEKIEID